MTVRQEIIRLLQRKGGEYRAEQGNAGRLIAEELDAPYPNVSTTLYRMQQAGEVEKEGTARRAYAYRLADPSLTEQHQYAPATVAHIPRHEPALLNGGGGQGSVGGASPDEIAAALLRRVVAVDRLHQEQTGVMQESTTKLRGLQSEVRELRDKTAEQRRTIVELEESLQRRDKDIKTYERELQEARNQVAQLQQRGTAIRELVDEDTLRELDQIMKGRPMPGGGGLE